MRWIWSTALERGRCWSNQCYFKTVLINMVMTYWHLFIQTMPTHYTAVEWERWNMTVYFNKHGYDMVYVYFCCQSPPKHLSCPTPVLQYCRCPFWESLWDFFGTVFHEAQCPNLLSSDRALDEPVKWWTVRFRFIVTQFTSKSEYEVTLLGWIACGLPQQRN